MAVEINDSRSKIYEQSLNEIKKNLPMLMGFYGETACLGKLASLLDGLEKIHEACGRCGGNLDDHLECYSPVKDFIETYFPRLNN